ncbi:hypothetical protein J1N35_045837 [Gossypium stocksii]|uniref:Uncharacterized protein n=1 Tax=Gossypium stocksii TaxID=47602 RepID=A0A9D3UC95_9ROSI|nr:hypothetical protein J1N35_045837 [Gossypium stocksii]
MGVSSFYCWLLNKYPNIRVKAIEEHIHGHCVDTSSLNPNGIEFDNLYLNMNDGVAPRAKMNQQRSRRFFTRKNDEIAEAEEDRLQREFELEGKLVLPKKDCEVYDSNVVTPGYISDANVPGEDEHKIMLCIRYQQCLPGYNCNTRHCLYGLDADLIVFALATHEVHFSILREDVLFQEQQPAFRSCSTTSNRKTEPYSSGSFKHALVAKRPYEFLYVWILREYIKLDIKITDVPQNMTFDLERIIDDFIFICFFVGNDFLPRLPFLDIHEGAIDLLLTVYKQNFNNIGGYLIDMKRIDDKKGGYIKLKRVKKFILLVGSFEEKIFKKRLELHKRYLRRLCQNSNRQQVDETEIFNLDPLVDMTKNSLADMNDILRNTKELKEKLKENLWNKSDFLMNGTIRDQYFSGVPFWSCAHALPKLYAKLITDADSQIIDFYPIDFEIDTDGKHHAWQGICKLPFIDKEWLLFETLRLEKELMLEETERNAEKTDKLFVPRHLGSKILTLLPDNQKLHTEAELIRFLLFKIPIRKPHIPRPLKGVEYPEKLRHEYLGTRLPYNRLELIQKTRNDLHTLNQTSNTRLPWNPRFDTCKVGGADSNSNMAKAIADMKISEPSHNSMFGYGRGQTWRRSSQQ